MTPIISAFDFWLSLCVIALQLVCIAVFLLLGLKPRAKLTHLVRRWALPLGFVLSLAATALTLVYSEAFGYIPCGLCWLERIMLYPQIALFGIAWWKGDKDVWRYIVTLSLTGLIIAIYHHYLQMGGTPLGACPVSGGNCEQRFIFEFGYVTFPLMAATIFAFLGLLGYSLREK